MEKAKMTKKQQGLLQAHQNMNLGTVYDVYDKPSQTKINAWHNILDDCEGLNILNVPKIVSFNTFSYSVSFEYIQNNEKRLRYYTSKNTYDFVIEYR